jgi:uncharacterized protein
MPLDLDPRQLSTVRSILAQQLPQHSAWAFGSRVKGTAQRFSDLDILVQGQQAMDYTTKANLRLAFSESDLPFMVDIVDLKRCNQAFVQGIANERTLLRRPGE